MATSRGVRLALLAARGLLKCPEDHVYLYLAFKEKGIDIELDKERLYHSMQAHITNKDVENYNKTDKQIEKLLYPDRETAEEKLMRMGKETLQTGSSIMKMGKQGNTKVDMSQFPKVHIDA